MRKTSTSAIIQPHTMVMDHKDGTTVGRDSKTCQPIRAFGIRRIGRTRSPDRTGGLRRARRIVCPLSAPTLANGDVSYASQPAGPD